MSKLQEDLKIGKAVPDGPEWPQPAYAEKGVVPKVCFRWILSGPSKSGKTNLARFAIDKFYSDGGKPFFDRMILMSPTAKIDWTWGKLKGLKDKDRITDCTEDFLLKLFAEQKAKFGRHPEKGRKRKNLVLLIMDDAVCESKLIHTKGFLKVFIAGRHYGISTMAMTQSYVLIPRSARIQATHVSLFPSRVSEIQRLYAEHGPRQLTKRQFVDMVQTATTPEEGDEFPFLYVDCFKPAKERFRRNFNEAFEINGDDKPVELEGEASERSEVRKRVRERPAGTPGKKRRIEEHKSDPSSR